MKGFGYIKNRILRAFSINISRNETETKNDKFLEDISFHPFDQISFNKDVSRRIDRIVVKANKYNRLLRQSKNTSNEADTNK